MWIRPRHQGNPVSVAIAPRTRSGIGRLRSAGRAKLPEPVSGARGNQPLQAADGDRRRHRRVLVVPPKCLRRSGPRGGRSGCRRSRLRPVRQREDGGTVLGLRRGLLLSTRILVYKQEPDCEKEDGPDPCPGKPYVHCRGHTHAPEKEEATLPVYWARGKRDRCFTASRFIPAPIRTVRACSTLPPRTPFLNSCEGRRSYKK